MKEPTKTLQILAHRGLHRADGEKNSLAACERAFANGFGIEIDVRDAEGSLVVAHDPADPAAYAFGDLCSAARNFPAATMAINIKSCGLQSLLADALRKSAITQYFTFDMSTPDLRANLKAQLASYTRHSDLEPVPALYGQCQGVWLDMFESDWLTPDTLHHHAAHGKEVAIVSPELHGRPHLPFWHMLKNSGLPGKIYLCTDHPEEAARFFNA